MHICVYEFMGVHELAFRQAISFRIIYCCCCGISSRLELVKPRYRIRSIRNLTNITGNSNHFSANHHNRLPIPSNDVYQWRVPRAANAARSLSKKRMTWYNLPGLSHTAHRPTVRECVIAKVRQSWPDRERYGTRFYYVIDAGAAVAAAAAVRNVSEAGRTRER